MPAPNPSLAPPALAGEARERLLARVLPQHAAFIHKPFSAQGLAAKVRDVLDGSPP